MANSDTVEVAVEIIDDFSDELRELEGKLEKIDNKSLNVDLDIDAGDIEEVEARLEKLEENLNSTLDIDVEGYEAAKAMKEELERDMRSTLHIGVDKDRLGQFGGDLPGVDGIGPPASVERTHRAIQALDLNQNPNEFSGSLNDATTEINRIVNEDVKRLTNDAVGDDGFGGARPDYNFGYGQRRGMEVPSRALSTANLRRSTNFLQGLENLDGLVDAFPFSSSGGSGGSVGGGSGRRGIIMGAASTVGSAIGGMPGAVTSVFGGGPGSRELSESAGGLGKKLKTIIPTMQKWWQLVAILIPVLVTLGAAALGAAAALGVLAGVGAVMGGIGILGYGDNMAQSMNRFKRDLNQAKREIAGVLQPVGNVFQPFTAGLLDRLPHQIQKLVDPLERLSELGFDTFFFEALRGTADWIADLIRLAGDLAPQIQEIGWAIGQAFGREVLGLLEWMVEELYNNWDAIVRLVGVLVSLVIVLYNVSKAISFALAIFAPLFQIIASISGALDSRLVVALLAAAGAMTALFFIMSAVAGLMSYIAGLAIAQAFWSAVLAVGSLSGALGALSGVLTAIIGQLTAINLLTGGVLLVAGAIVGTGAYFAYKDGFGGDGPGSAGGYSAPASRPGAGGAGTEINIYGDVGNKEYQKLADMFPGQYATQSEIETETTK